MVTTCPTIRKPALRAINARAGGANEPSAVRSREAASPSCSGAPGEFGRDTLIVGSAPGPSIPVQLRRAPPFGQGTGQYEARKHVVLVSPAHELKRAASVGA